MSLEDFLCSVHWVRAEGERDLSGMMFQAEVGSLTGEIHPPELEFPRDEQAQHKARRDLVGRDSPALLPGALLVQISTPKVPIVLLEVDGATGDNLIPRALVPTGIHPAYGNPLIPRKTSTWLRCWKSVPNFLQDLFRPIFQFVFQLLFY